MKSLSILIPWNTSEVTDFDPTIESIKGQQIDVPIELVIVAPSILQLTSGNIGELNPEIKFIQYPNDAAWVTSKAVNLATSNASGELLTIITQPSVLGPKTLQEIVRQYETGPSQIVIAPEIILTPSSAEAGPTINWAWEDLQETNNGVPQKPCRRVISMHRNALTEFNGYDERLHSVGLASEDIIKRARNSGLTVNTLEDEESQVYSFELCDTQTLPTTPRSAGTCNEEVSIVNDDKTIVRNIKTTRRAMGANIPLVTIAINSDVSTSLLNDCVESILSQSVQSIEIRIVGHEPETVDKNLLEYSPGNHIDIFFNPVQDGDSFVDTALKVATGQFIIFLEGVEILPEEAIESHLSQMRSQIVVTQGQVAYFDTALGVVTPKMDERVMLAQLLDVACSVESGSWMARINYLRAVNVNSVVDNSPNLLLARSLRTGIQIGYTHRPTLLIPQEFRLESNIGNEFEHITRLLFAQRTCNGIKEMMQSISDDRAPLPSRETIVENCSSSLPDHLVERDVQYIFAEQSIESRRVNDSCLGAKVWRSSSKDADIVSYMPSATKADLARLRSAGASIQVLDYRFKSTLEHRINDQVKIERDMDEVEFMLVDFRFQSSINDGIAIYRHSIRSVSDATFEINPIPANVPWAEYDFGGECRYLVTLSKYKEYFSMQPWVVYGTRIQELWK